jgi:hypothetical protein
MRTSFSVNDMTIHRIVEQESGFTPNTQKPEDCQKGAPPCHA